MNGLTPESRIRDSDCSHLPHDLPIIEPKQEDGDSKLASRGTRSVTSTLHLQINAHVLALQPSPQFSVIINILSR